MTLIGSEAMRSCLPVKLLLRHHPQPTEKDAVVKVKEPMAQKLIEDNQNPRKPHLRDLLDSLVNPF